MENSDRKEGSNKSHDASLSSDDDSSDEVSHPNQEGLYYSSHVASVCHAINSQVETALSPFEQQMLRKRREANRLSARRRRKRKGDEIKQLEEDQFRLITESKQLIAEKTRLQATLQNELDATFSGNNRDVANFQRHVPPWAPHSEPPPLLHLLQQQAQLPQQFSSSTVPSMDPSINPFARPMSAQTGFDLSSVGNLDNISRDSRRDQLSTQPPPVMPFDLLPILPFLRGSQGAGVSPSLVRDSTIAPQQTHAISNPEFANSVSAIAVALAVLHRHQQPENSHNSSEASQRLPIMNPRSSSTPSFKETNTRSDT